MVKRLNLIFTEEDHKKMLEKKEEYRLSKKLNKLTWEDFIKKKIENE